MPDTMQTNDIVQQQAQTPVQAGESQAVEQVREKILHSLTIYPFLSGSMINVGIGTSTMGALWKPVLKELIDKGIVTETNLTMQTPQGRSQSYNIFHLTANPYNYNQPELPTIPA